jgi:hypothetical protein
MRFSLLPRPSRVPIARSKRFPCWPPLLRPPPHCVRSVQVRPICAACTLSCLLCMRATCVRSLRLRVLAAGIFCACAVFSGCTTSRFLGFRDALSKPAIGHRGAAGGNIPTLFSKPSTSTRSFNYFGMRCGRTNAVVCSTTTTHPILSPTSPRLRYASERTPHRQTNSYFILL